MSVKIRAQQASQYIVQHPGDCIWLTYTSGRHTAVLHGIQGTVTTRPGELGVYLGGIG